MDDEDESVMHAGRFISGGMAGVAFVTVIQLLQLTTLSRQLIVALCCFASSLPFLVFCFTRYTIVPISRHRDSKTLKYLLFSSSLVTIIGLVFVFFHLNNGAGFAFSIALGAVIVLEFVL
jgi:hypothetical protein